jgi:2-dehydropantoate 2-reductase
MMRMRFVVVGAGAVGGVVGGRLAQHGHAVVLVARGRQYDALRAGGLQIESPAGAVHVDVPAVERPDQIDWRPDDVVLLAVKTQDSDAALADLAAVAPREIAVVCMQNGVVNERLALRRFTNVYGICVACPTGHLTPGVVEAWSAPTTGLLDIGRYPSGVDATAEAVAARFRSASFGAQARMDIMRWKYGKLLLNLGNAIEAICGPAAHRGTIAALTRREGVACLEAAGIEYVGEREDAARRADHLTLGPIAGRTRPGGSSWQSLRRRARSIETDYLNGEIVLLGRLFGVPTPVNELLQRLANRMARAAAPPASLSVDELLGLLPAELRAS